VPSLLVKASLASANLSQIYLQLNLKAFHELQSLYIFYNQFARIWRRFHKGFMRFNESKRTLAIRILVVKIHLK
jgi:hypothetical protein